METNEPMDHEKSLLLRHIGKLIGHRWIQSRVELVSSIWCVLHQNYIQITHLNN
jgi:hypothetical protein